MPGGSAAAGNFVSTYDIGFAAGSGNREDLLDLITNIDPWDTPFYSSAPKVQAQHVTHEWLTDTLSAVSTAGGFEGGDFSGDATTARRRINNITQIFRYDINVADTQRAVNPAGVRDEYEYQVMKAVRQIARNIEATVFKATGVVQVVGAEGTVRTMNGFRGFTAAGAAIPVFTVGGGSGASALTADLIALHETVYTAGGNPDTLYLSPGSKADFTANVLSGSNRVQMNIGLSEKKLIANIDVFESDFGLLAIIPDRFLPSASTSAVAISAAGFLIERSKARIATLRPVRHVPIGKGGDGTRGIVVGELTLEVLHPSAHGILSGLIT